MFSGLENITVAELRDRIVEWHIEPFPSGSEGKAIWGLIGAIMILCNRIAEMEQRWQGKYRRFEDGEELAKALRDLHDLKVGTRLIYHGILHEVIDCGEDGHRITEVFVPGLYEDHPEAH